MFGGKRKRWAIAGAAMIAAVMAGGAGLALAAGTGDDERPITGDALDRATEAALAHTGGGVVTETEVGDEEGYYEVEVTRDDGSTVDVHLDEQFNVMGQQADARDGPDDEEER